MQGFRARRGRGDRAARGRLRRPARVSRRASRCCGLAERMASLARNPGGGGVRTRRWRSRRPADRSARSIAPCRRTTASAVRGAAGNVGGRVSGLGDHVGADRRARGRLRAGAVRRGLSARAGGAGVDPLRAEGDDAALADVVGFLDFIDAGARALGLDVASEAAPLERLRAAQTLAEVSDRAAIVRATGVLGASIRRALGASGLHDDADVPPSA